MVKLPPEVKEVLEKQKPIPIATSSKKGVPNVIYVGRLKFIDDETIYIADNFFRKTAANLAENPRIAILCWDAESKRSYQIKGSVKVHRSDEIHNEVRQWMTSINPKLPAKAAVVVKVEEVFNAASGPTAGEKIV